MPKIKFTKMHGCGNDYIYVDAMHHPIADPHTCAKVWSDRHKGIGSDGLVLIDRSPVPEADFSMRIFNADGSEAMMCGNASRCIGKYLYERGLTDRTEIRLLTLSGIKTLLLHVVQSRPSHGKDAQPLPSLQGEGSGCAIIRTRVWERGSGVTMACGTGACATAVAACLSGRAGRESDIVMDGGTLHIEWRESDNHVYMTGPAAFVFDGEVEIP